MGRAKAKRKGADFLAVNRVGEGVGFGDVPNTLRYVDNGGADLGEASGSKEEVAADLVARVTRFLNAPSAVHENGV